MAGVVGPEERRDYTVMGDTVNTTARLMSAAPSGAVFVGEETWRATRRSIEYREATAVKAKGKHLPLRAWEAVGAAAPESAAAARSPFVGRDEELQLLRRLWAKVARESIPHLVTVMGEPGVGKSRLTQEFEREALAGGGRVVRGRCVAYGEALGYSAFARAISSLIGIAPDDRPEAAFTRLSCYAGELASEGRLSGGDPKTAALHLARLMGIAAPDEPGAPQPDQRTLHTTVRLVLEASARRAPLCLVLEDIQWADEALLDLVEFVAARAQEAPLLLYTMARPELLEKRPTWGGGVRSYAAVTLNPVDDASARSLIHALLRDPAEADVETICRLARGNPLFIEELAATLGERGLGAGIPSSIRALISARLDRLPAEEKRTSQAASVFGEVF